MRKFTREVSKQLGRLISFQSLLKYPIPVFQPFYHVVSDENLPHILNYNYRNTSQFEKELDFYLEHFKPVTLDFLLTTTDTGNKTFHLSFDDGLKECAEVIAPILLKKGIPATFFVNTGFADNKALFHKYKASLVLNHLKSSPDYKVEHFLKSHKLDGEKVLKATIGQQELLNTAASMLGIDFNDFLKTQKPYLTTEQLLNLQNLGFTIGTHSSSHPEFWKIPEPEQMQEIRKSMEWLVKKLNPSVKAFSFPFTDSGVSLKVLKAIKEENICDLTFGTAGIKHDSLSHHFQRYPVEQPGNFGQNLKAELVYYFMRDKTGKSTVIH